MARLTHNYVAIADRTQPPMAAKPKTRYKSDWAWRPYRTQATNGPITVLRPGCKPRLVAAKAAKREFRG